MVKALLEAGAWLEADNTPLQSAISNGNVEVVKALIDAGASLELGPTDYGNTPLKSAIFNGNVDVIQTLIDAGASLDSRRVGDITPLLFAMFRGNVNVIKVVLLASLTARPLRFAFLLIMWLTALNSSLANGSLFPILQATLSLPYLLQFYILSSPQTI